MDAFFEALVSDRKSDIIPGTHDLFGPLVGEWDVEWHDRPDGDKERIVKGEWIFSRVLDGTAVQDVFIVPSRNERKINPQPDAAYGTTIRFYNPQTMSWDVFYGTTGIPVRLNARRVNDEIVLTETTEGYVRWVFTELKENTFIWKSMVADKEMNWTLTGWLSAKRKT